MELINSGKIPGALKDLIFENIEDFKYIWAMQH